MDRPRQTRFFADSMLGTLARWMRTLGYDVEYERDIDDALLLERAVQEDRLIRTQDTLLVKRKKARNRSLLVEGGLKDALKKIVSVYPVDPGLVFSRCIRCNSLLLRVEKEFIKDKVPAYVFSTRKDFFSCNVCKRIYWAGTHRERMLEDLKRLLDQ